MYVLGSNNKPKAINENNCINTHLMGNKRQKYNDNCNTTIKSPSNSKKYETNEGLIIYYSNFHILYLI